MSTSKQVDALVERGYEHGFVTDIETDVIPPGPRRKMSSGFISQRKQGTRVVLEYRLKRSFGTGWDDTAGMVIRCIYPQIDFQAISYFAAPTKKPVLESLDQVDPEAADLRETRHPAGGAEGAGRGRRRGCSTASRWPPPSGKNRRTPGDLLLDLGGGA